MLGILVVFGVPGIILGGLTYHWFHSWAAVLVWEIIMVIIAAGTAYNAAGKSGPSGH
jgi:hypothetical protein